MHAGEVASEGDVAAQLVDLAVHRDCRSIAGGVVFETQAVWAGLFQAGRERQPRRRAVNRSLEDRRAGPGHAAVGLGVGGVLRAALREGLWQ